MIEVGEYVRTKKGYIAKITEIDNFIWFDNKINKESGIPCYELSKVEFENLVTKHSKNIIDLIEEGDYVNGEKIGQIENGFLWYGWSTEIDDYSTFFKEKDIETIVTKEQMAQMEYKIKE